MADTPRNDQIVIPPDRDYSDEPWWESLAEAGNDPEAMQIIGQVIDVLDLVGDNSSLATDPVASTAILQVVPRIAVMQNGPAAWTSLIDTLIVEMTGADRPVAMEASGLYNTLESSILMGLLIGAAAGIIAAPEWRRSLDDDEWNS